MKHPTLVLALFACTCAACDVGAGSSADPGGGGKTDDPGQGPSAEGTAERVVRFLADDRLKGRVTPSAEEREAADFLAHELQTAGLAPIPGVGYQQRYPVE